MIIIEIIDKLAFIKIKNFCAKDSIQEYEQATDWKKILWEHISEKGLLSKTY